MSSIRPRASLLALSFFTACFAPEGSSPTTGTTTAPAGTTTAAAADPTNEATTAPGTGTEPSTTGTTGTPTTTDPSTTSSTTAGTTTGTTDATTSTATTDATTGTTTTTDSTTATTLPEPECLADLDCPNDGGECKVPACIDGRCTHKDAPVGSLCNGFQDQCDAMGLCVDCVDNGGCGECCVCAGGLCIPN
ncbi:hypothetical protein [Nannocystis pusilla]|uniref:hypothetical protein n=1 Tax=Nannocystis pusilla TaxID=889268 RepID=UPI003BF011A0